MMVAGQRALSNGHHPRPATAGRTMNMGAGSARRLRCSPALRRMCAAPPPPPPPAASAAPGHHHQRCCMAVQRPPQQQQQRARRPPWSGGRRFGCCRSSVSSLCRAAAAAAAAAALAGPRRLAGGGVDARRAWSARTNSPTAAADQAPAQSTLRLPASLVGVALQVLHTGDPGAKAALTHRGWRAFCAGAIPLHPPAPDQRQQQQPQQEQQWERPPDRPARPPQPRLVVPKQVPSFKDSPLSSLSAHLLHNLAHIELNAVDLAWDTVARFSHLRLPDDFYADFARVADDESRHFGWCAQRLGELGHSYGDMAAHDLLWEGAQASAGNLTARLAIVPMSQEARGLDAGQRLAARLVGAGDNVSAAIVARIALEERAHVAVGVVWFKRVCEAMGLDPLPQFKGWVAALGPELLKGPFNHAERELVGLPRELFDVASWPQEEQAALALPPAAAAAARGRGDALAASAPLQNVVPLPEAGSAGLEVVRQRLWQMLQAEAAAAAA